MQAGRSCGVGFGVSVQLFRVASTTKSLPVIRRRKPLLVNWHFLFQDKQWPGLSETGCLRFLEFPSRVSVAMWVGWCLWPIIAFTTAFSSENTGIFWTLRLKLPHFCVTMTESTNDQHPWSFLWAYEVIAFHWVALLSKPRVIHEFIPLPTS